MDPMVLFLKEDILLDKKSKADKVRRKAPWFWLSDDKKLCKHLEVLELLLEELHEGICGSHIGGRSLSH